MGIQKHRGKRGWIKWIVAGDLVLFLLLAAGFIFTTRPDLAARGADALRAVFGDEAVASLEMVLFQAQDTVQKMKYQLGLATPAPPWQPAAPAAVPINDSIRPTATASRATTVAGAAAQPTAPAPVPAAQAYPSVDPPPDPTQTPETAPSSTAPAAPETWQPTPLAPLGGMNGEGAWSPYLQDASGRAVAYRTFLQVDPTRPFALVAVIAFDLSRTRLHYMLGFEEPYAPDGPKRSGAMPEADKASGFLLAMFNGGFKATHGKFGAMSGGVVALPAQNDLGTLAIYQDGRVRMGVWGISIQPSEDMEAWRQNGPLVVQDGAINPRVYNNSPKDWGYTVNDVSPTWRSGIGVSADEQTLFYFAGPSLTMEALGKAMIGAGAAQGMQLDINNYWVHFVAVRDSGGQRVLEPLFPEMMKENIDRYLYPYSRDYFYVTAKP